MHDFSSLNDCVKIFVYFADNRDSNVCFQGGSNVLKQLLILDKQ